MKKVEAVLDQRIHENQTQCQVKFKGRRDAIWVPLAEVRETDAYDVYCSSQEFIAKEVLEENEDGTEFLIRWENQVEPTWEAKENIDDCAAYDDWVANGKQKTVPTTDERPVSKYDQAKNASRFKRKIKIVQINKLPELMKSATTDVKRVKTEAVIAFTESEGESSDEVIVTKLKKPVKKGKMRLQKGNCTKCGAKESVRFTKGLCSGCYQQWRKNEQIKVKKELEQSKAKDLKVKEEFNNAKKCSNCWTRDETFWRGDLCGRCFKQKINKKMNKNKKKRRLPSATTNAVVKTNTPAVPDAWKKQAQLKRQQKGVSRKSSNSAVPASWKKQAVEKKASTTRPNSTNPAVPASWKKQAVERKASVPASWKKQAEEKKALKKRPDVHMRTQVVKKKPSIKKTHMPTDTAPNTKKRAREILEVKSDSEDESIVPPPKKKRKPLPKVKAEGGNSSKAKQWTEEDFYMGIAMLREDKSWGQIAKAIGDVSPEKVEKYFKKFRKWEDPIYEQDTQFNWVGWNRPSQKWLVNVYSVYMNRYETEDEAAAAADAVCADVDPDFKGHNLLPKSAQEVQAILSKIPSWKDKRAKILKSNGFKNRHLKKKRPKAKKRKKAIKASDGNVRKKQKTAGGSQRSRVKPEPIVHKQRKTKKKVLRMKLDDESSDEDEIITAGALKSKSGSVAPEADLQQNIVLDDELFPDFDDDDVDESSVPKPTPPSRSSKHIKNPLAGERKVASNGVTLFSIPKKRKKIKNKLKRDIKQSMRAGAIPKKTLAQMDNNQSPETRFPSHWKKSNSFSLNDNVLVCAECDWQFTLSLAKGLGSGKRVVATCYKNATDCPTKFGSAFNRRGKCERLGVKIVEHVDVTNPEILLPVIRKNLPVGEVRLVVPFILHSHSSSREMNRQLMKDMFKSLRECSMINQVDLILHRKRMSGDGQFEYWNVEKIANANGFKHLAGYKMLFKEHGANGGESCDFPGYFPSSESGERIWPNFPQLGFFHSFRRIETTPVDYVSWPQPWLKLDPAVPRELYASTVWIDDGVPEKLENRVENRDMVEQRHKLHEFGMHPESCLILNQKGDILFKGYERIVYGDHGPYLEFLQHNVMFQHFGPELQGNYYNRRHPKRSGEKIKLYCQKKRVSDRPNPPKGRHSVHNDRPEGYADYRPGRFYVDPMCYHLSYVFPAPREKNFEFLASFRSRESSPYQPIATHSANSPAPTSSPKFVFPPRPFQANHVANNSPWPSVPQNDMQVW